MEALLLVDDHLIVAGTSNAVTHKGGFLWVLSAEDGTKKIEILLNSPSVLDGLTAAQGRLYLSTRDGRLHCFR